MNPLHHIKINTQTVYSMKGRRSFLRRNNVFPGTGTPTIVVLKLPILCTQLVWYVQEEEKIFCLIVKSLSSHSSIFHTYWDVIIAGEGLKMLTYAQHSWPLRSESSLACHNYCDKGHPFIMVISEDLLPSV